MDDTRVGEVIRAVRRRAGLTQAQVAARAVCCQAVVSDLERGRLEDVGLPLARRVCAALDIRLPFAPRWRGPELVKLLDSRHALIVNQTIELLAAGGWECLPECTFSRYGERGSVDIVAWRGDRQALVVVEVKSRLVDFQDALATMDRKARLVPGLLRAERGWSARCRGLVLVVPASTTTYETVRRHSSLFHSALPGRTKEARGWLRRPFGDLHAIWFVPNIAGGNRRDGRGRPAPRPRTAGGGRSTPPRSDCGPGSRDWGSEAGTASI